MKKFIKNLFSGIILISVLLNSINVFANQNQVVKISVGNNIANVNGNNIILSTAPYIQKSSGAMMIPLRFVSTSLGIDENNIKYNANTKEISITYNGKIAKFIVGTNKLIIDGKDFSMLVENKYPIYTEIKNGSTFIPLRSLELAFDNIKIDWEATTKTAILKNEIKNITTSFEQPIIENNTSSLIENSQDIKEPSEKDIRAMEEEVVRLVNEERIKNGLQPLEISEKLMKTAREKSEDMYKNNYFSHISPKLGSSADMMRSNNVEFTWMAENIAKFQKTPVEVVQSWMNSKGHRENILNPNAKYTGVGYYGGIQNIPVNSYKGSETEKDYITYWTQQFIG